MPRWPAELAHSQGEQVVLHQDLHGGNVLRAERSPWLAIDPKPLVGEREFDLASLIRDTRERIDERLVRRRLDLLSELLGLDRERMRCWALVHALAWGVEGDQADAEMIELRAVVGPHVGAALTPVCRRQSQY